MDPGCRRYATPRSKRADNTVKPMVDTDARSHAADAAIARVLHAEADAVQAIEQARQQTLHIADAARVGARAVAERTERRIRAVVAAFERQLAERLAEIDAEAVAIARPHEPTADELAALGRAVGALAQELAGVQR